MDEQGMTQRGLEALTGINHVKVSRLLSSATRADREDLTALILAFHKPDDRFRLLRAHIQDEIPEESFKDISVTSSSGKLHDAPTFDFAHLPKDVVTAIRYLITVYEENPAIGLVFVDLASAMGLRVPLKLPAPPPEPQKLTRYPKPSRQSKKKHTSTPAGLTAEERQ